MTCLEEDTCPSREGDNVRGGRAGCGIETCCVVIILIVVVVIYILWVFNEMIHEFNFSHGRRVIITDGAGTHRRMIGIIKSIIISICTE